MYKQKFLLTLSALCLSAMAALAQTVTRTDQGVTLTTDGQKVEVTFLNNDIVRVVKYPTQYSTNPGKPSMAVVMKPQKTSVSLKDGVSQVTLSSKTLRVNVDKVTGEVSFLTKDGKQLLTETGKANFTQITERADKGSYKSSQSFKLEADEAIYGLGNLENGKLSQRDVNRTLLPGNVEDGIPYILSVKGYGVYWDNYSPVRFTDNQQGTTFESTVGNSVDYYFMRGNNADGVVAQMRELTGQVPMFPLWTYGFWQSRERYKSQAELLEVVTKYRELGVPIDGIIQDWQYWGNNYLWNAMEFMNADFPNAKGMVEQVHKMNAHIIPSIWSSFGPMTKPYRELDAKGLLFNFSTWPQSGIGEQWPPRMDYPSGVRVYNTYSAEARDIYWKHLKRLYDLGMDGWWMDSTEPDHFDGTEDDMDTPTGMGSFRSVRNAYPLLTVGGVYDHQRAIDSTKRVFILTRSGYAGQQRYGCNVWSGDVTSSWDALRNQVNAGLNFTLTGNPNFNSDIGGFFCSAYNNSWGDGSAPHNPAFQELYTRWMQFAIFTPMMRSHGADAPREVYQFGKAGEPIYDAQLAAIKMRYSLLPYIYSTSWQVTSQGYSFMRALMMDFPADKQVWNNRDAFMFGQSLLVAPVLKAQYTPESQRKMTAEEGWNKSEGDKTVANLGNVDFSQPKTTQVYLPQGADWYDFNSNKHYQGGQTITLESRINLVPVFARAGAIIPMGPDVQYATEKKWDNLELRVYAGADGSFTLYEDEGDNYNYEKGVYSTIALKWDNKARRLTIAKRQGSYPGMLGSRSFRVTLVDQQGKAVTKTVNYTGRNVSVKF